MYKRGFTLLKELIFNPCGEFRWSPEGPVSQIHSPHLHDGAPGIFSYLLWSVQMLKREGARKATGSYRTYKSLEKLQTWLERYQMIHNIMINQLYEDTKRMAEKRVEWRMLSLLWKTCPWAEHYDWLSKTTIIII